MEKVMSLLEEQNTTSVVDGGGASSDTAEWVNKAGVPGAELDSYDEDYFNYHHSHGTST
jgi:hypothetical protein